MKTTLHNIYIIGSFLAAMIAAMGIFIESPALYGIVPGLIGGTLAAVATVRFLKHKRDLAGFVATVCGFVFYQAFQGNPVMLREFTASLGPVAQIDRVVGIFLGNFTTGMLLLAYRAVSAGLARSLRVVVPLAASASRERVDRRLLAGFALVFAVVAMPNVLFGQVIVGAIKNILYQRATWSGTGEFSGFDLWGGPLSTSLVNMIYWSTSLFLLWIYLLGSRYRLLMLLLSPLILLWTASVALQGSRTYLVTLGFGLIVYYLGSPKFGMKAFVYAAVGFAVMFFFLQAASFYRNTGLQSIDFRELGARIFEIRGNEGTPSEMDGLEFFRTEYLAKNAAPNPLLGFVRGMVERPIEGILMPLPRSVFPWKPVDESAREFDLFFQNVRLGVPSQETFLGASPGLMGRELIRYGFLGPITVLFWLGLVLALADRLYSTASSSDFHRIFASVLVAFFVAEMRDWVPMWFLPFLPVMFVLGYVARKARKQDLRARRKARAAAAKQAGESLASPVSGP